MPGLQGLGCRGGGGRGCCKQCNVFLGSYHDTSFIINMADHQMTAIIINAIVAIIITTIITITFITLSIDSSYLSFSNSRPFEVLLKVHLGAHFKHCASACQAATRCGQGVGFKAQGSIKNST